MADRPIIFSAPMVRALLDGRKTQHRLPIKGGVPTEPSMEVRDGNVARHERPYLDAYCSERRTLVNPRGMSSTWCWWTRDDRMGRDFEVGFAPGDRLWVREAWKTFGAVSSRDIPPTHVVYLADETYAYAPSDSRVSVSIHTPRWASRLTLVVTDVRVHTVRKTTDEEAIAEGLGPLCHPLGRTDLTWIGTPLVCAAPDYAFRKLWDERHGDGAWLADPFVVALTFTVHRANIDALPVAETLREPAHA